MGTNEGGRLRGKQLGITSTYNGNSAVARLDCSLLRTQATEFITEITYARAAPCRMILTVSLVVESITMPYQTQTFTLTSE
jgi:hypothetical protein